MNIAIYDTEHFETTYAFFKIYDLPEHTITLLVTPSLALILKQMLESSVVKYNLVIISNKNKFSYLWNLYKSCKENNIQILILNTISFHHILIGILCFTLRKTKCLLTIHDANNFFASKASLNIKRIIRHLGKMFLLSITDGYITLLSSTKKYIIDKYKITKPIYHLPGGVFEEKKYIQSQRITHKLRIAIPGSVDVRRRNYEEIFELISILEKRKESLCLILLGTANNELGQKLIKKFKALKTKFVKIEVFESSFIDQSVFDTHLSNCDMVYIPLKEKTVILDNITEEYGLTKATGVFFDAIRHAKPILLPHFIKISEELTMQCIRYNSISSLASILIQHNKKNSEAYYSAQQQAYLNALNFRPTIIRKQLNSLFS